MAIIAHAHPFVVGVDTHARTHTYAILAAATGELLAAEQFPTTPTGLKRALAWVARLTGGDLAALWIIECIATYGARVARAVADAGYEVAEAARMDARANRGIGKSDPLDARRIAAAVLPLDVTQLRRPRADDGVRAALRVLTTAREQMSTDRTSCVNALTALLRSADLGADARKPLTSAQISEVAAWRTRAEDLALSVARAEAVRLAKRIGALNDELADNQAQLKSLVQRSNADGAVGQDRHRARHCCGRLRRLVPPRTSTHRGRVRSARRCQSHPRILRQHQSPPAQPRRRQETQPSTPHGHRDPHGPPP